MSLALRRATLRGAIFRDVLPDGPAGTRFTLKCMRELVRASKEDAGLRDLAQRICAHVPAKAWRWEIVALFQFVRTRIKYSLDTNAIEVIQWPRTTLKLGYGDCDDLCTLLACLIELKGHPAAFAALGFEEPGVYSHVIVIADPAGEGDEIALDPTENYPPGWFPPGATCMMLAPIEGG